MSEIAVLVGQNIRKIRQTRGLSQENLALKAEMNPSYVGQVERGEKSPTIDSLEKIANGLDVELEELFHFNNNVEIQQMTVLKKIEFELKSRTEEEQEVVYRFVKQLLRFRDRI